MRSLLVSSLEPARAVAIELAALCGVASVVYGVWQIYEPAAFVVAGMSLLAIAAIWARE